MKIAYEVRFTCYQYNGGGNIRNGYYPFKKPFDDLAAAQEFAEIIKKQVGEHSREFARDYVWDGFVHQFDGIYNVTEEKL